jgi:hypothetical protein
MGDAQGRYSSSAPPPTAAAARRASARALGATLGALQPSVTNQHAPTFRLAAAYTVCVRARGGKEMGAAICKIEFDCRNSFTNLQISAPGVKSIGSEHVCFYVELKQICADLKDEHQFLIKLLRLLLSTSPIPLVLWVGAERQDLSPALAISCSYRTQQSINSDYPGSITGIMPES